MKKQTLLKLSFMVILTSFCYILLLVFLYQYDNKYTYKEIQPVNGVLCLSEEDFSNNSLYFLKREWQYYPNTFLTPKDFFEKTPDNYMQFVTIGKYQNYSMGNFLKSPVGTASYRLVLFLPAVDHTYSLLLPEIYSSYRLYINDRLITQLGNPEKENFEDRIGSQILTFHASGKTSILLNVTNYKHYTSGMVHPPAFGSYYKINRMQNIQIILRSIVITAILITALFSFYFSLKLKQKVAWLFSLLCICTAIFTLSPLIFSFFTFPVQPWASIELISSYGMYLLMVLLQNYILKEKSKLSKLLLILFTLFYTIIIVYNLMPVQYELLHQFIFLLTIGVGFLVAIYLFFHSVRAVLRDEIESGILLSGTVVFALSILANIITTSYEPIYGGYYLEYGSIYLIFTLGYVLWKDLVEAYQFKVTFLEERRQLNRQIAIQKSHYLQLTQKIENSIRLTHDQRHHFRMLHSLLENNEIQKALEYLNEYNSSSIERERTVLCDNLIIDAILQYYSSQSKIHNIYFEPKMDIPPQIHISDTDLSLVFANLLENAMEACQKNTSSSYIKVSGKYKENKLFIRIENNYEGIILQKLKKFLSTKHDGFGIGIESVKSILKNYDGIIDIQKENGVFLVSLIIPS